MYHSRVRRTSWSFANCASTMASGMQWNARSHAAYQGYSHLSGIEMMSALFRCCHSELRRRLAWVAVLPLTNIEIIELLAPDHARKGLPLYPASVIVSNTKLNAVVK